MYAESVLALAVFNYMVTKDGAPLNRDAPIEGQLSPAFIACVENEGIDVKDIVRRIEDVETPRLTLAHIDLEDKERVLQHCTEAFRTIAPIHGLSDEGEMYAALNRESPGHGFDFDEFQYCIKENEHLSGESEMSVAFAEAMVACERNHLSKNESNANLITLASILLFGAAWSGHAIWHGLNRERG